MCKNTTPLVQPCTIVTQAQIDASEIIKHLVDWEQPSIINEALHELFMGWLYVKQIDGDELGDEERDILNLYHIMHKLLGEVQGYYEKHGNSMNKREGVAA